MPDTTTMPSFKHSFVKRGIMPTQQVNAQAELLSQIHGENGIRVAPSIGRGITIYGTGTVGTTYDTLYDVYDYDTATWKLKIRGPSTFTENSGKLVSVLGEWQTAIAGAAGYAFDEPIDEWAWDDESKFIYLQITRAAGGNTVSFEVENEATFAAAMSDTVQIKPLWFIEWDNFEDEITAIRDWRGAWQLPGMV